MKRNLIAVLLVIGLINVVYTTETQVKNYII